MLSDSDFWQRVRRLRGQTVYTFTRKRPNRIVAVDDEKVTIEGRKSRIYRYGEWGLLANYRILHRDGYLLIKANSGNGQGYYIIMPIIAAAVPEEAYEAYEGLRLRKK